MSCSKVTHQQWTDNSAARMLVQRQGVGRIRHLSGKILWIQNLVLQEDVTVGQIPTAWNYSDVGTKPLARNRLLALLNQLGVTDPITFESVGQEEYELAAVKTQNEQSLKRLTKAILRMTAAWGLESGFHVGAEAAQTGEVCQAGQASGNDGNQWLWVAMFFMLLMMVGFAIKGYFMWKQVSTDLAHCWRQVGDEDAYVATQEARIDALMRKFETLEGQLQNVMAEMKDEIQTIGNETSMVHDYASGLHYSIVENGGFLRNGLGLTHQQWVHLTTLERANMVAARVMGSVDYMRAIRQRYGTEGPADETDAVPMEAENTASSPSSAETISGLLDFLKIEHNRCLENMELWDANAIQSLILQFLEEMREASGSDLMRRCVSRVAEVFMDLHEKAIEQNRWESADRYQSIAHMYGPD